MSTMTVNSDNQWELNETLTLPSSGESDYVHKIRLDTANFGKITRNIKYVFSFSSTNLAVTSGGLSNNENLVCTTAGWWFKGGMTEVTRTDNPETTVQYKFDIVPYKTSNNSILLKDIVSTYDGTSGKSTNNKNIELVVTVDSNLYGIGKFELSNGWMAKGVYVSCSGANTTYLSPMYSQWKYIRSNSDAGIYVQGKVSYGSTTYTCPAQLLSSSYGNTFLADYTTVSRSGSGSPGSPYSYTGSAKIRIKYKSNNSSSWSYTSYSTSISGSSGYYSSINMYAYKNDVNTYPQFIWQ